jgi:hypothetical protein
MHRTRACCHAVPQAQQHSSCESVPQVSSPPLSSSGFAVIDGGSVVTGTLNALTPERTKSGFENTVPELCLRESIHLSIVHWASVRAKRARERREGASEARAEERMAGREAEAKGSEQRKAVRSLQRLVRKEDGSPLAGSGRVRTRESRRTKASQEYGHRAKPTFWPLQRRFR